MPEINAAGLEALREDADAYRLLADQIGILASDGWDDDAAEVSILIAFVNHLAKFHPDCPGRWCTQQPPTQARLSAPPIPLDFQRAILRQINAEMGLELADNELLDHHSTEGYRTAIRAAWNASQAATLGHEVTVSDTGDRLLVGDRITH